MIRGLRAVAAIGLGVGIVSLAIAYTLGGRDVDGLWDHLHRRDWACDDGKARRDGASERRLAWNGEDAIDIAVPASVRLRAGEGNEIVVRGAPDIVAHVAVHGDHLVLDCHGRGASRELEVVLPGKAFHRIGLSGSGRLTMENLSQPEMALRISGNGSVRAQGSVDRLSVAVAGSGDARLADLAVKALTVKIAGSGSVEAAPQDEADVSISGSGNLKLLSRPVHLTTHISGSGRLSQVPAGPVGK
ncbi:Putative auto-transporter adhesin, head GIN domain [Enhydrobacter aerosaccus]|uniref:Putative auto-transporter adhesin, head GIN domain n=1 Tax=Enhydrobacter aerosaccus TaxID=225324 RepID=A0A1T4QH07_9HYPH|nr:DUF2807 domain-containing protein [Enhydrobacter aerosaccus]SKA02926.1 Putative auto-transporter adhesin, head GIN domain [Enhydrobacter aerosaccus]